MGKFILRYLEQH